MNRTAGLPVTPVVPIVEPIVSVVAAPRIGNQERFPNEDSRAIDLDDTNVFRRNRFTGLDRVEGGQRVSYGVNVDTRRLDNGARFAAFLGQSYRFQRDGNFPGESGLGSRVAAHMLRDFLRHHVPTPFSPFGSTASAGLSYTDRAAHAMPLAPWKRSARSK